MNTLLNQFSVMRSLLRHPDSARDEIVAFQNRQLRRLITHAYENVPYYRRLFDRSGLTPNDIQSVSDLPAIPITSKKDLQLLPAEEIVARDVNLEHLIVHMTSGSSGEPFTIRRTRLENYLFGLFRLRNAMRVGLRMRDSQANVVLIRPEHPRSIQLPIKTLRSLGLLRKVEISCLLPPEEIVRRLRNLRPDVLTGLSGVISWISQVISDDDRSVIRPRLVLVGGEVLTSLMRMQITKAFAAPVLDYYASYEFGLIAWECKETGELHTCEDSIIIEVLKDGRPAATGERGEVVGTNLHSFAMPLIRYRLGDIVTKGSETCRCGQQSSTIRAIQGCMIDYFLLPGGRIIHPYEITVPSLLGAGWIRQYQLIQEQEDRITLRVVPSTTPTTQELTRLKQSVITVLGQAVEFHVILVPEIQFEPNGKFRVSRSLVKSAYDGIDWNHS
ncbi:MAG: phenylacetate--CoA ligase family protein [Ignavibacteriales bacterium]